MNKNIFLHELRANLRSIIVWSLSLIALVVFFFSLFQSMADQAVIANQLMEKFPTQLKEAFGLGRTDLSTVLGFYALLVLFIELCIAIQGGNIGFGLVSIEESERTADFLLTRPVRRSTVLTSKLLAALATLLITNVIVDATTVICITAVKGDRTYDAGVLALLMVGMFIFQLFFMAVGVMISLIVKRVHNVTPFSLGMAFGAYVLNAFSGIFGDVKLEYITPFKHFDPNYIVQHSAFDTRLVIINVAVTVIAVVVSYWLYIRRDIPAVS